MLKFNVNAITRWEDYRVDHPKLQNLAIRILNQVCSSSTFERLWRSLNNIHTKKQNGLGLQKAKDLVLVNAKPSFAHKNENRVYSRHLHGFP